MVGEPRADSERRSDGQDGGGEVRSADAGAQARQRAGRDGLGGQSTLDLIGRNPHMFEVVALTAQQQRRSALAELAVRHGAALAVVADDRHYAALEGGLAGTGIEVGGRLPRL